MPGTEPGKIRNVAVIGHRGTGKTSLVEALLFETGTVNRLGSVTEKTTVSDYDDEERRRGMSISASVTHLEWEGRTINLIDTPGEPSFQADVLGALRVVEGAIVTVSGVMGVEVGTERLWKRCEELGLARLVLVNLLDRERADFFTTLEALQTRLSPKCVAVELPIGREHEFHGVIDLVHMVAYDHGEGAGRDEPMRDPRRPARDRRRVPRQADGRRVRDVRRADGALPGGRRDQPRGDGGGAQEARHRGRALPGRLRRGDPQHRLARPARPDRRGPAVAASRQEPARGRRCGHGRVRVQDDRRPVQRQAEPAARLLRRGQVRLDARQQPQPRQGADRAAAHDPGQGARADRGPVHGGDRRGARSSRRRGRATSSPTPTRPPTSSRWACPRRSSRSRSSRSTRATRRRS